MRAQRILFITCLLLGYLTAGIAQGNCLSFSADSEPYDVITIGNIESLSDFTIETWLYINAFSSFGPQLGSDNKTDGCRIKFSSNDIKVWTTSNTEWSISNDNSTTFLNKWGHFALTFNSGKASIYINGELIDSTTTLPSPSSLINFTLGTAHTNRFFNGKMEEFRFWTKALSSDEIKSNKEQTLFSQTESAKLLIHYDFNQTINNQIINIANPGSYNGQPTFKSLDEAFILSDAFTPLFPISAQFSISNNVCPTGSSVSFINNSQGDNLSYSWSFPGGTPTSSTAHSPNIHYHQAGSYDVTLSVSSGDYTATQTQKGYIWVGKNVASALQSIELDGTDDYIKTPGPFNNRVSNYTIEFWIYLKSMGTSAYLPVNNPAPFYFGCDADGRIKVGFDEEFDMKDEDLSNDSSCVIQTSPNTMELYKWQHFAFVFDQGTGTLYKNGEVIGQNKTITPDAPGWNGYTFSNYMTIGSSQSGNTMNGRIDEFRVWSCSRPVSSLHKYMTLPVTNLQDDLVINYQFDDNSVIDDTILVNNAANDFYGILRHFNPVDMLQSSGAFSVNEAETVPTGTSRATLDEMKITVYSKNKVLIIDPESSQPYSLIIHNVLGQQLYFKTNIKHTHQINNLKPGIYVLTLSQDKQQFSMKIIHW